jgi:hypothetical protein
VSDDHQIHQQKCLWRTQGIRSRVLAVNHIILTDDQLLNLQVLHGVLGGGLSFGLHISGSMNILALSSRKYSPLVPACNGSWIGEGGLYSRNSNSAVRSCHRATHFGQCRVDLPSTFTPFHAQPDPQVPRAKACLPVPRTFE